MYRSKSIHSALTGNAAAGFLLTCVVGLFNNVATAATNQVSAAILNLYCDQPSFAPDNSATMTCHLKNDATGPGPAIMAARLVVINKQGGSSTYMPLDSSEITVGSSASINLSYQPNSYPNFVTYQAYGIADDAIFGDVITPGEPLISDTLRLVDPNSAPTPVSASQCSYESFLDANGLQFPYSGGVANFEVDTQPACQWYINSSNPGMAYFGNFNSFVNGTGFGAPVATISPNIAVNGSTTTRQTTMDVNDATPNIYHGKFTFTQAGITCVYSATGFSAPQGGVTNGVINVTAAPQVCQWQVTFVSPAIFPGNLVQSTVFTGNGSFQYSLLPNTSASPRTLQIMFGNALTITAVQPAYQPSITFNTIPSNLSVTVDGQTYSTPQTFSWTQGSQHTIGAPSPQALGPGAQYGWVAWGQLGSQTQTITATTDTTYTASFVAQYLLTTAVTPPGSGIVTPASGNYYWAGTNVPLTATALNGATFENWTGPVITPNQASTSILVNAPATVTANFMSQTISVVVNTSVPGLTVTVDGANYPSGQTFQWTPNSQHTLAVNSPQDIASGDYAFASWSDGGSQLHTVSPAAATTYTANFTQLTTLSVVVGTGVASGSVQVDGVTYAAPQTFQWMPGDTHSISAPVVQFSAGSEYVFSSWSDGGASTHTISPVAATSYTAYYYRLLKPVVSTSVKAVPPVRIHAGGAGYTDASGNLWSEDSGYSGGTAVTIDAPVAGSQDPGLYQSERSSADAFSYRFNVPDGKYAVTLKFADLHGEPAGSRLFDVAINGNPALTNFDPATVAGPFTAIDEQFHVVVTEGRMVIGFLPKRNEATISGIELVPEEEAAASAIRVHSGRGRYVDAAGVVWEGDHNYAVNQAVVYRFVVPNGNYYVTPQYTGLYIVRVNGQKVPPEHGAAASCPTIPVSVFNGEIVVVLEPQSAMSAVSSVEIVGAP